MRLTGLVHFHIGRTLACGQCFRYEALDAAPGREAYRVAAFGKTLTVEQDYGRAEALFYPTDTREMEALWIPYFDLDRNYEPILLALQGMDDTLCEAVAYGEGIRLLNQQPWETLISFIVSQNNNIPRIRRIIRALTAVYGSSEGGAHAFPSPEALAVADIPGLLSCNAGFRGKYILDAARRVANGALDLPALQAADTPVLRQALMTVHGVGPKVADCVMLYAFGRREVFPVDVWVRKVMHYFYGVGEDKPPAYMQDVARERFGALAGYAQQYLFHYARSQKTGRGTGAKGSAAKGTEKGRKREMC